MATHKLQIYGAWLYEGIWDGHTPPPPVKGWKLLRMAPGRFTDAPKGFVPDLGEVTLLGQGDNVIVVTPD